MRHFTIFNKNAGSFSSRETHKINEVLHSNLRCLEGKLVITPNISFLEEVLEEFRTYTPDILGIGGGDGTAAQILTSVEKHWGAIPNLIAPYALGTMNNWVTPFGLSDGLVDKVKKAMGIGETKPLTLARYIAECTQEGRNLSTESMGLLDLNGEKGFNFGLGLVPKLVWSYYGKSIAQYQRLEGELMQTTPDRYKQKYEYIFSEKTMLNDMIEIVTNGKGDLLKKTGFVTAIIMGAKGIVYSLRFNSPENAFYREPIHGKIYIDGKKIELAEQPLNIYCAMYEQASLGLPWLTLCPSPEARSYAKKMQVIITFGEPLDVVRQIPHLFRGKKWGNNIYYSASELEIVLDKPGIAQLDAEYKLSNRFVLKYDTTLNFIAPFRDSKEKGPNER
ncbi:hypothetical protein HYX11_00930 [Candidatus Woesearchaeota archaeon]|nr:hypothetical protein [Candidatus Woesearchaeota archaeon]